jgi:phosphatidylserine decarboxylase
MKQKVLNALDLHLEQIKQCWKPLPGRRAAIGMRQVSSVIVTAEAGVTLRKGEEMAYLQFGGSDIIVPLEAKTNASFVAQSGVHYKTGLKIADA